MLFPSEGPLMKVLTNDVWSAQPGPELPDLMSAQCLIMLAFQNQVKPREAYARRVPCRCRCHELALLTPIGGHRPTVVEG